MSLEDITGENNKTRKKSSADIQFNSIEPRLFKNLPGGGGRAGIIAVGFGSCEIADTRETIVLPKPAVSIKTLIGGTITDILLTITIMYADTGDATVSDLYAQLYTASPAQSEVFYPVPGTVMKAGLPAYPSAGTTVAVRLSNISVILEPETQFILGLYNTTSFMQYSFEAYVSGVVTMEEP